MDRPIISVSGLRGIVGKSLDPIQAIQYIAAFVGQPMTPGPIVLTRDGRSSGPMLADAISSAIMAIGRDVLYGDVAATPTTGILVRSHDAAGGIQISASHNPADYNGIKLFGSDGRVIPANIGEQVIAAIDDEIVWSNFQSIGRRVTIDDTIGEHLRLVLQAVDADLIRSKRFTAVLDSNHGAGSVLGRALMEELNVTAAFLGDQPDGEFSHPPEPTRENLKSVSEFAAAQNADVVFCQDPDADRLALIDEKGEYVGEEYTLAITLKNRLEKGIGPCVINCATSRMNIDIANAFGCECRLSAVGEANVCDEMIRIDAVYGGEGNGGPIDPKVGYVRDSFVGMAQVLEAMAKSDCALSQLVKELPHYAIHKTTSTIDRDLLPGIFDALLGEFDDAKSSTLDGLRFDWNDRWLLVRPSNTEPIVRIICETNDQAKSQELAASVERVIRQTAGIA